MKFNHFILYATAALFSILPATAQRKGEITFLSPKDFKSSEFNSPDIKNAPFTRWWWPGNDVSQEELKREIDVFHDNHFGGVEIQVMFPLAMFGDMMKIFSFDTPSYYENLDTVFEYAAEKGLTVDLTDGSGWPAGGPHISAEEGNLSLQYGITDIPKGKTSSIALPRTERGDQPSAKLVGLVAAKLDKDNRTIINSIDISSSVKGEKFQYSVSEDGWKAIALWEVPCMESNMIYASMNRGYVMNHFDKAIVEKNYKYFFDRPEINQYYGKPLRAIFDDSYEFKVDRHFSDKMIDTFKKGRGYDPTKYLPAVIWYGYNNMYDRQYPQSEFSIGENDWRLRYDYDLTVSDAIRQEFLKSLREWTESRGILHRTQTYGLNMDMMGAAGDASIPEVETMLFGGGPENGIKLITSAAELYNRPVVTSESLVHIKRAYTENPQKIKLTIDKLLSAGVNQIIYHGTSYQVYPENLPKEGWFMFYNPSLDVDFSSDIREGTQFWKYMDTINQYIQRAQYVLRSGKSDSDVLIYYPFLSYNGGVNPEEILNYGYMPENEPPFDSSDSLGPYSDKQNADWLKSIMPLINELNSRGISWSWVNDESLKEASVSKDGKISIRGNEYEGLILFNLPYIQIETARHLNSEFKKASILVIGNTPTVQPSLKDFEKNDIETAKLMAKVSKRSKAQKIAINGDITPFIKKINTPIRFKDPVKSMRFSRRAMSDGSIAQFIWNYSDKIASPRIVTDGSYQYAYVLDAEDGSIQSIQINNGTIDLDISEMSTKILYLTNTSIRTNKSYQKIKTYSTVTDIKTWNITSGNVNITNSQLIDWRKSPQLKASSQEGVYTSTFNIENKGNYILDLGTVYYSAQVYINGVEVGTRIFKPFKFDISDYVVEGTNTIEVRVTPSIYNDFATRGENGDKNFSSLVNKGYMAQGILGPVTIQKEQ